MRLRCEFQPPETAEAERGQWTIKRVLRWTSDDFQRRGLDSPRLDAELLLAHAIGLPRIQLYLDHSRPLQPQELARVRALVRRRRLREPVAYIVGQREFFGRPFVVNPSVLIPRPDTEVLVEQALGSIDEWSSAQATHAAPAAAEFTALRLLDLATGSGAVAISVAAERPHVRVDATDACARALATARDNAKRHGVLGRMRLFQGDLFAALPAATPAYRLVTCNPPYIASAQWDALAPEIRLHEPASALLAGHDGYAFYERLASEAWRWLEPGGWVLLEVGAGQAARVVALLEETGKYRERRTFSDLAGIERVVAACRALSAQLPLDGAAKCR